MSQTETWLRNVYHHRGVYTAILKLSGIVYKIAYQKHVTAPGGVQNESNNTGACNIN